MGIEQTLWVLTRPCVVFICLFVSCYSRKTKPVDSLSEEEVDAHVRVSYF